MELVYLWVEDYKNIHKQGFNFSPRFECTFHDEYEKYTDANGNEKERLKDNCKLDIEPKKHIENFFGENINVTVIVGKNGSGKSSVLNYIEQLIFSLKNNFLSIEKTFMLLYYFNKKLYWIKSKDLSPNIVSKYKVQEHSEKLDFFSYYSEMPYDSFSFFNEDLSGDLFMTPQGFSQMKKEHYVNLDSEHIGELLLDSKLNLKSKVPNIFEPTYLIVKNNEKFTNIIREDIQYYISQSIDPNNFDNDLLNLIEEVIVFYFDSYEICLLENLLKCCSEDIISYYISRLDDEKKYSVGRTDIFKNLYDFLSKDNYIYQSNYISTISFDEYYEKIDKKFLFSTICFEDNLNNRYGLFFFDYEDSKNRRYSLLSHGEKILFGQMLNYHYRLNSLYSGLLGIITNDFFLIDEPDISLHPFWQKKYIELIIQACKSYKDKNTHIIITTHSPFLLSDIPKQNIIFLDKDENGNCKVVDGLKEKKQTFGANIHTLLSDSFFMEDGLMGEFAKTKIQEIMDFLNDKKSIDEISTKEDDIKKVIEAIGEPFLKEKLLKMYDDKYPKTDEDKIYELEAEIERIRSGKNQLQA